MAKKVKAKKTASAAKKKEATPKPKARDEKRPDQKGSAQKLPDLPADAGQPVIAPPKTPDLPIRAPSVAVTPRKSPAVPVSVPETRVASPAKAVQPEPPVAEPPPGDILAILKVKTKEDARVVPKNLATYRDYIERYLDRPARVCGREPFGWERPYAWGLRNQAEYERRKAACPSYSDALEIVGFDDEVDAVEGVAVRVSRLSDGKEFSLLLTSLRSADAASKNAEILDAFAEWFQANR